MATISCEKTWTLTVSGALVQRFWTLDEMTGSRLDSVAGVPLVELGVTPGTGQVNHDASAGFIGEAVHFYQDAGGFFQDAIGDSSNALPSLAQTGNGFSIAGWIKIVSLGATFGAVSYLSSNESVNLLFSSGIGGVIFRGIDAFNSEDFPAVPIPIGTWTFFHLFYNKSLGKMGFEINNDGLPGYVSFTPVCPAGIAGMVYLWQGGFAGAPNEYLVDQVSLRLDSCFSAVQITYLYNSGFGRTWPFSLPP